MDLLKNFFEITGDIFYFYAELKKLCVKDRENIVHYIDRPQIVYNNIVKAEKRKEAIEKSERGLLTSSDR